MQTAIFVFAAAATAAGVTYLYMIKLINQGLAREAQYKSMMDSLLDSYNLQTSRIKQSNSNLAWCLEEIRRCHPELEAKEISL